MSSGNFQKAFLNNFTIFITLKGNKIILHHATQEGKEKEVQVDSKTLVFQPTEEESEYNPTPHTLSTIHYTPTLLTNHIPPHYHTTTFPTIIRHPIPAHPHKRHHPFINGIMETPLPTQWEAFMLERCGGGTHPDEHVKIYVNNVYLYTTEDVVMCKAFPTTLKGPTLEWFTSLPPYSIDCFDTLFHVFMTQFAKSHPHSATPLSLFIVRQKKR